MTGARTTPKPPWVHDEVLRLKAFMPHHGCRKISIVFNYLHHRRRKMTVGKTFVATVLRKRQHDLAAIRRQLKHKRPRPMPRNIVWALDLTYFGERNHKHTVLGLLDHGSRACLALSNLRTKTSVAILRAILDAIERFGKPRAIRTDNEATFTSMLFRLALRLLGIRPGRTVASSASSRPSRSSAANGPCLLPWIPSTTSTSSASGTTISGLINISTALLLHSSGAARARIFREKPLTSRPGMGS